MSDTELLEIFRVVDDCKIALAKAEEDLHVAMAARQARREIRAAMPPLRLLCPELRTG